MDKRYKLTFFNALKFTLHTFFCGLSVLVIDSSARAESAHGLALYGIPALSKDFKSLPYADADAPQGGRIVYGERGRFDSLNPYTVKGRAPWAMRTHVYESLMTRSWDEAFTVYGLLAESAVVEDDRSGVTFHIHPEAKFADGTAVTAADVVFSMETLRDKGRPNFATYYNRIVETETPDERTIRFTFDSPDRELPLLLGLMPILSKADWEEKDFTETTLEPPIASGPYEIESFETGDFITLRKRADYWGEDLPINRGLHNFDEVTYVFYRDDNALWEAFKAGEVMQRRETDPARWAEGYNFPAYDAGDVLRDELPHGRATGMYGFTFNTRNAIFDDLRVREALTHAFDFEWVNEALNRGAYSRITSYYANSELGFTGKAEGLERALLEPFENSLPPGTLDQGYTPPVSDGDGRNRRNLRTAAKLLREAGWTIRDGVLRNADGEAFSFEVLLNSSEDEKIAATFARTLERLGIDMRLRLVEGAQYLTRLNAYDFDMILRRWWLTLSPGAEQRFYFGSQGVTDEGTRNYMGAKHPAIDAMIDAMLSAEDPESYRAAVRALDRVLVSGRYVIPLWYEPVDRFAWWKTISKPQNTAIYGYRPEVWWSDEE